ncbi:hypothetical protein B0H13DRAFT_40034 [Mycena leptocephala]|nr:hypothetical protein B0H13DRAFT_40034 [Mycena leptocephala]
MFFVLSFVLSCLFLPAACQFDDFDNEDGFHPDPLTAGLFALLCIFALLYGVMSIWNFVALLTSRGHRASYAFLLPTISFFSLSNAAYIAEIILENIPALDADSRESELPILLLPTLGFVGDLFYDWAVVLQFLVLIAVLWNRETQLRAATDGKFGGHHPALIALHATLATLTFIFGTATEAYNMDTNVKLTQTDFLIEFEDLLQQRDNVRLQLYYAFNAFAVLTAVDVAVTTLLLWRSWRKAGMSDKITNLMLYAVVPLYSILGLFLMIFTIVFSPVGIPNSASVAVFEGASLASNLLITGFSITILFIVLFMSVKKVWWNLGGVEPLPQQQYWTPQPQYVYAAPPQVTQAGYYVAEPGQSMPYGQPQMYPAQGTPPMQHVQYAHPQPHESSPGSYTPASPPSMQASPGSYTPASYTPASPPSMQASPGSYTPPQSDQGTLVSQEKTGFHVA